MQLSWTELELENIGRWPMVMRALLCTLVLSVALYAGWQCDLSLRWDSYQHLKLSNENIALELKQAEQDLQNIEMYEKQIAITKEKLDLLQDQLPEHNDTVGVLEALSQHAAVCDLQFRAVKPGTEEIKESYHAQTLELSLLGNYHGFGKFLSLVANMPRCVTIHDLSMLQDKTQPEKLEITFIARMYWRPKNALGES